MANVLVWKGLDDLRAELLKLPADLTREGMSIVASHVEMAKADVIAAYPFVSGNLQRGVRIEVNRAGRLVLQSRAPHAWLYEFGSGPRTTAAGANRGAMPAAPLDKKAIPKIIRWRSRMYAQLAAMLERHGLRVSGSFAGSRAA